MNTNLPGSRISPARTGYLPYALDQEPPRERERPHTINFTGRSTFDFPPMFPVRMVALGAGVVGDGALEPVASEPADLPAQGMHFVSLLGTGSVFWEHWSDTYEAWLPAAVFAATGSYHVDLHKHMLVNAIGL